MRIFTAVRHTNEEHYYGALWSRNFYPALRALGHEIVESQVDLFPVSRFMDRPGNFTPLELETRARITQAILDEVTAAHRQKPIAMFLCYFYNSHFDPDGFEQLRRLGIPSVNFYCNSINQFDLVEAIAAKVDFSWHSERDCRASYLAAGARPVWVQMGADPEMYRPVAGIAPRPRLAFIGQRYADRDRWLAALLSAGQPLDIYGAGWQAPVTGAGTGSANPLPPYLGRKITVPGSLPAYMEAALPMLRKYGPIGGTARVVVQWRYRREGLKLMPLLRMAAKGAVPADAFCETVAGYAVHLNLSNIWADGRPGSALVAHVRLRDFEIPMCRACYLTGHTDEIEEFYDVGKEIETYSTREELIDKTRFLLANPAQAERLRAAGFARARADHTWGRRFALLFDKIGLRPT